MDRLFWLFALGHLAVWTLVPTLVRPNASLDTVEMVFLGHEWQLGYPKHPPLPCWISEAVAVVSGRSLGALYLAAQAAVVVCFWAAYRLAREMVSARMALVSACLLECCCYYNLEATVFSHNVGLYPWWALAVASFYGALRTGRNRYWLALGATMGLGMLSKYTMAVLILTMLGFLVANRVGRRTWFRPGPYLAATVALALFAPHLAWTMQTGFSGIHYAMARTQSELSEVGRLLYPAVFAGSQLLILLPLILSAAALTGLPWRPRKLAPSRRFNRDFLLAMTLGPLLFCLAASAAFNLNLKSMYGSQMWTFAGLTLLYCVKTRLSDARWRAALAGCAATGLAFVAAVAIPALFGPALRGRASRIHFPGRELAVRAVATWEQKYRRPLQVVAGDYWLSGNVAFYGPGRPSVYPLIYDDHGSVLPPSYRFGWIDDDRFQELGGMFFWDPAWYQPGPGLDELRQRFPTIEPLGTWCIPYQTRAAVPPAQIGVAIVPPGRFPGDASPVE